MLLATEWTVTQKGRRHHRRPDHTLLYRKHQCGGLYRFDVNSGLCLLFSVVPPSPQVGKDVGTRHRLFLYVLLVRICSVVHM